MTIEVYIYVYEILYCSKCMSLEDTMYTQKVEFLTFKAHILIVYNRSDYLAIGTTLLVGVAHILQRF